jgi:putative hydrolase of the HAD superfamily
MPSYLGLVNYHLGVSVNVCELNAQWETIKSKIDDYWLPYKGISTMLDGLKQKSIGLGVISNWDCTARDILSVAGLIDYFEPIIISCEVNCSKPDPAIFNLALQKAAISARDCIYIGDNYYDDAVGSQKVGMPALIINRFGSLGIEEIKDCPIINDISEVFNFLT